MNKIQFAEEISKRGLCFYFISFLFIYLFLTTDKESFVFSGIFVKEFACNMHITLKFCFSIPSGVTSSELDYV